MAKSLRSKVKRDFRSKKRETGIYAATEAARLNRLNAKLASVMKKDKDGDEEITAVAEEPGWSPSWFAAFGLFDAMDITAESMNAWAGVDRHQSGRHRRSRRSRGKRSRGRREASQC